MASRILIKTSNRTGLITTELNNRARILATGEMGYSYLNGDSGGGDRLFIGAGGNTSGIANEVHIIGGKYYTDMMDQPQGQTVPQHAVITDADNKVSEFHVDNIDIDGNEISTSSGNLVLNPTTGVISAGTSQIKDVVDPTDPQDALTLNYYDNANAVFVNADVNQDGTGNVTTGGNIQVRGTWNTNTKRIDQPSDGVRVEVALDSDVLGLASLTVDNVKIDGNTVSTTSGDLILDPTPTGNAGKVIIAGDLQVDGTTTTVNSTTLEVEDKNITLAKDAQNRTQADSAGIHVNGAEANIFYDAPTHSWNFDVDVYAPNLIVESDLTVNGGLTVQGGFSGEYQGFDSDFAQKTTDDLTEGSNLYFTTQRARNSISVEKLSGFGDIAYDSARGRIDYTGISTAEIRSQFAAQGDLSYDSSTGVFSIDVEEIYSVANFDSDFRVRLVTTTTDSIGEGSNLYFTTQRARNVLSVEDVSELGTLTYDSSRGRFDFDLTNQEVRNIFSASGDLNYNAATGDFSIDVEQVYTKANFDSDLRLANTDQLPEGDSNLYYHTYLADSDFDIRFLTKTTDSLAEGDNNLYYTTARADSDFDVRISNKTTTNLTEGSNLYFTTERAQDAVASLLHAGEAIDLNYTDGADELTVSVELASANNPGAAKFDATDFLVTAGNVEIATIDCGTY